MKTLYLVTEEQAGTARHLEQKLLAFPPQSGILFVGVEVEAAPPGEAPLYHIFVGCSREFDPERMIPAFVDVILHQEREHGLRYKVHSRRGVCREVEVPKKPALLKPSLM